MNRDFVRIAHRRAVFIELQRILMNTYISSSIPAKKEIFCEEVPQSDKEVDQDAIVEVFELLERLQQSERTEMLRFEFRRRDDPAPKKKKKKRAKPDGVGGEGASSPATPPESVPTRDAGDELVREGDKSSEDD